MAGAHHTEVQAVERGQLALSKPFDDREDGRVDEADTNVGACRMICATRRSSESSSSAASYAP